MATEPFNTFVSGLGAVSLTGTELVAVIQSGASVQATTQDIANLGGGSSTFVGAQVLRSGSNFSLPDSVKTALEFDNPSFDTSSFWNAGAPTLLTVPTAGHYLVTASAMLDVTVLPVGKLLGTFTIDGAASVAGMVTPTSTTDQVMVSLSCIFQLNAADFIEFSLFQNSGAAVDILATTALIDEPTQMSITFLGA